jgi:hypothetical protein
VTNEGHSHCWPENVYVSSSKNPRKGNKSHTINSSVAANVVLQILAACVRIMAAFLWNLAPGNHDILQDGNNIYEERTRNHWQELGTNPESFFRNLDRGVVIRVNVNKYVTARPKKQETPEKKSAIVKNSNKKSIKNLPNTHTT